MEGYHKYVFDTEKREFVGQFEDMYLSETKEGFDSWHQEDLRNVSKKIAFSLLENYKFETVLDIGCGKGSWTHLLKKNNNRVIAIDISQTALGIAQSRYPDIKFQQADLTNTSLSNVVFEKIDLTVSLETLSYLSNWKDVLSDLSAITRYCLLVLFIPDNPIGFVKSEDDLCKEYEELPFNFKGHYSPSARRYLGYELNDYTGKISQFNAENDDKNIWKDLFVS